jgi:tetratricopeptide (TPR) repeat protein
VKRSRPTNLKVGTGSAKEASIIPAPPVPGSLRRYAILVLMVLVLLYAALSGLRTLSDPDTGWQLATGKYIVEHHQIPSTDVLSYTIRGQRWIYPPFSQLFLYALYSLGGFAALSWLNAAACAGTVGIAFLAEQSIAAALLGIIAIPRIAFRTDAHADMFTTVLFAVLLVVVWRHFRGRYAPLWLVPLILLVWVNTHLGFIAGLALLVGYVALELSEFLFAGRRAAARARLRAAAPWLLAAVPVTLLNRWGWGIYGAVYRQEHQLAIHQSLIGEWRSVPLSPALLAQALNWGNLNSTYLWLLGAAVVAAIVALKRKEVGPAAFLVGCTYLSVRHVRFQALFAIVVIVVAAPFLTGWFRQETTTETSGAKPREAERGRLATASTALLVALGVSLMGIWAYDIISDRAYLLTGEDALFGAGLSKSYPENAAEFILRERLPGNIFNDYELGGYLAFRLGPQYPDYVDSRAIPFVQVMFEQREVMRQPPDSEAWREEADRRGTNTLIFSLARSSTSVPLRQFCTSQAWKPVYLDNVAAVFVRNRPENAQVLDRLQIDCAKVRFEPPATLIADTSFRGRAELFNFYANAGSILYRLSRNSEAEAALDRALEIFPDEPNLLHTRGRLYEVNGRLGDAEREYQIAARRGPTDGNWASLGMLYFSEQRYPEATRAMRRAADSSPRPSQYYHYLGRMYLTMKRPQEALDAFKTAEAKSFREPPDTRINIEAKLAEGRAMAWADMGDLDRAVEFQREALKVTPLDPQLWTTLARFYEAQGRESLAQQARQQAAVLSRPKH